MPERKSLVLFVHGFSSSAACWDRLISLLRKDERVMAQFDVECFEYPTRWFNWNPLKRIPRLAEIARSLRERIDSPRFYGRELRLVGHSQGGLVILGYLYDLLTANEAERLAQVRQVILIATPVLGSTLLSPVRKLISLANFNPQERSLRVLDPEIADIRRAVTERIVGAKAGRSDAWPVPIHCFYGLRDGIVVEASAKAFESVTPLDGDHFSILQPTDHADSRYDEFTEVLLEPTGHRSVFEVSLLEQVVRATPLRQVQAFPVQHGMRHRVCETDNIATVRRTVTFSPKNRCQALFSLAYSTRNQGFVNPTMSHPNEASPQEKGRYDDYGMEVVFKFTPKPAETYSLQIDVYKGFDPGHRDLHFHLNSEAWFRQVRCVLDLSPYIAAGYAISQEPTMYRHARDPESHDLDHQRSFGIAVPATSHPSPGLWTWEFHSLRGGGALDLLWDVQRRDQA